MRNASLDNEENDNKQKKLDLGKYMPKVKLPLLTEKGNYLQFAMTYQEQTRDFTNASGQFEGDKNKLLQLVKDAMVDLEDKKILVVTYDLQTAITYLNSHYNSDRNLSNTCFAYLDKIPSPKNIKDMYSNWLEIFHNMKVIISMGLEGRVAQETLYLVISRSFTLGANRAFLNETNRAIMLAKED